MEQGNLLNTQIQAAGISWMLDMGLYDNPQVINVLKLNILARYPSVVDCEFLIAIPFHQTLCYLKFRWWVTKRTRVRICGEVDEIIQSLFSTHLVRSVSDKEFFDDAVQRAAQMTRKISQ